jgi:hypothetical protein
VLYSEWLDFVLHGEKLTDDTFADDVAHMANTIEELQILLECFCTEVEMNVKKSLGWYFPALKRMI